jgi:hypothetical protein
LTLHVRAQLVLLQFLIAHLPPVAVAVDLVVLVQHLRLVDLVVVDLVETQQAQQETHLQLLQRKVLQAEMIMPQTMKQTAVAAVAAR